MARKIVRKSKNIIRGSKLAHNAAIQARYRDELMMLVRRMTDECKREIKALYNTDHAKAHFVTDASIASQARILTNKLDKKFQGMFDAVANKRADEMVKASDKQSRLALNNSLKNISKDITLKTDSPKLNVIITASTAENVALIKSIPEQYMHQVQTAVLRSITQGNGLQDLIPQIEKYDGMTERRATNIALDQTRKVFSAINTQRMKSAGLKQAEWVHSGGGEHPRESHMEMDGEIYDIDEGCFDDDYGDYVQPAELPFCGCTMVPVITFEGEDDEPDITDTEE